MTHDLAELLSAPWMPATPATEAQRLEDLKALPLASLVRSRTLANIASTAAAALDVSIAAVSLVDREREHFVALTGDVRGCGMRVESFCAHTILEEGVFLIRDAWRDDRFRSHPQVVDQGIRFYAGAAVYGPMGRAIGALCVRDVEPRDPSPAQLKTLERLAAVASDVIRAELTSQALEERNADLARAREQFQLLLESETDAKYGLDLEGACTSCNTAFLRMFGFHRPGEVLGRRVESLIQASPMHADERRRFPGPVDASAGSAPEPHVETAPLRRQDGSIFLAERRIQPVVHGDEVIGAFVSVADLAGERSLAERGGWRDAGSTVPAKAVIGVTWDGVITDWGRGAESLFGRSAEERVGASLFALLSPGDREDARRALRSACRDATVVRLQARGVTPANEFISISLTFAPVQSDPEAATGCAVMARRTEAVKGEAGATWTPQGRDRRAS